MKQKNIKLELDGIINSFNPKRLGVVHHDDVMEEGMRKYECSRLANKWLKDFTKSHVTIHDNAYENYIEEFSYSRKLPF